MYVCMYVCIATFSQASTLWEQGVFPLNPSLCMASRSSSLDNRCNYSPLQASPLRPARGRFSFVGCLEGGPGLLAWKAQPPERPKIGPGGCWHKANGFGQKCDGLIPADRGLPRPSEGTQGTCWRGDSEERPDHSCEQP